MKRKNLIYLIIVVVVFSAAGIYTFSSNGNEDTGTLKRTAKVTSGKIQKHVVIVGQISPSKKLEVSSSITGEIVSKNYLLGDSVNAGEVLLKIKPDPQIYIDYLQMKKNYYSARVTAKEKEKDFFNSKRMFEQNHLSKDDFEKITNSYELSKIDLELAENIFETKKKIYNFDENSYSEIISIKAPLNGIIIEDNVEVGTYVISALSETMEGTKICVVGNFEELRGSFTISEEHLAALKKSDSLKLMSNKDKPLGYGLIDRISPIGNNESGFITFDFSIRFKLKKYNFYSGASVKAEIMLAEKSSCLRLPIPAINFEGSKPFIFLDKTNPEEKQNVKLGLVGNKFVEIVDGVSEGDVVRF